MILLILVLYLLIYIPLLEEFHWIPVYVKSHFFLILLIVLRVLLLNPFIEFLNFRYLAGLVEQHNGIKISKAPLFVIIFLKLVFLSSKFQYHILENYKCHSLEWQAIQNLSSLKLFFLFYSSMIRLFLNSFTLPICSW